MELPTSNPSAACGHWCGRVGELGWNCMDSGHVDLVLFLSMLPAPQFVLPESGAALRGQTLVFWDMWCPQRYRTRGGDEGHPQTPVLDWTKKVCSLLSQRLGTFPVGVVEWSRPPLVAPTMAAENR